MDRALIFDCALRLWRQFICFHKWSETSRVVHADDPETNTRSYKCNKCGKEIDKVFTSRPAVPFN